MKQISTTVCVSILMLFLSFTPAHSQQQMKAVTYLEKIGRELNAINLDSWEYISEIAHGKNARKAEVKRKDLLRTSKLAVDRVSKMPDFKGSTQLRDSVISYLNIHYIVLNHDYGKILDLEAIAEESYDNMEAYLLAQELANQKLDSANERMMEQQKAFALANNINLLENKDKMTKKMEKIGDVMKYYHSIYLIFFKSNKQEAYLVEAQNKKDINGLEQNKNALASVSADGLEKLKAQAPFRNDKSLLKSCKNVLDFFQLEATTKTQGITDYYIQYESFEKLKKSFETKPKADRTNDAVNQFNNAVNNINQQLSTFNKLNNEINNKRSNVLNDWDNTVKYFMARYIPKYKP